MVEQVYHGLFHAPNERADTEGAPAQVEHQVRNELAGAVIRDLAAAVDAHYRDAVVHARQVFRLARDAQRVHRRMLEQPDLVRCIGTAPGSERLHALPRRLVIEETERANYDGWACGWMDGIHVSLAGIVR
jgi:hypothetical protein